MAKTITQIVVQKKHKDRCSIFLDDEFGFGLHQDVVIKYGLKKGDSLTDEQIEEILLTEEKKQAKDRALRFLSYRDRSEKEMKTKLEKIGYDEKIIDEVIGDLKRIRLIDDERFALLFASSKIITRPQGEYLLRRELQQKGIDKELVEHVIQRVYQEKDQLTMAMELAAQRKKRYKNIEEIKAKKRVSDFLIRRGFNWEIVTHILEHWDELILEEQ